MTAILTPSIGVVHQPICRPSSIKGHLKRIGDQVSMSRKGDCWDNAVVESFFASLKKDHVYRTRYKTKEQAKHSIFEYIEVFYNRIRPHSRLGFLSPVSYEKRTSVA